MPALPPTAGAGAQVAYACSKGAVLSLSRSLAAAWGKDNIQARGSSAAAWLECMKGPRRRLHPRRCSPWRPTRVLALPHGVPCCVQVNCLVPGAINTGFLDTMLANPKKARGGLAQEQPAAWLKRHALCAPAWLLVALTIECPASHASPPAPQLEYILGRIPTGEQRCQTVEELQFVLALLEPSPTKCSPSCPSRPFARSSPRLQAAWA